MLNVLAQHNSQISKNLTYLNLRRDEINFDSNPFSCRHQHRQLSTALLDMCGIFCHISRHGHGHVPESMKTLLSHRGPDSLQEHRVETNGIFLSFAASVLSMRGPSTLPQPLVDPKTGSILCWNGEAWKIDNEPVLGNDTQKVFNLLVSAASDPSGTPGSSRSKQNVLNALSRIHGPFACVFHDAVNQMLYFGRDCLGRRSLLQTASQDGDITIASISDPTTLYDDAWIEVEADGLYLLPLQAESPEPAGKAFVFEHIPLSFLQDAPISALHMVSSPTFASPTEGPFTL
jgi:hypothetical protein